MLLSKKKKINSANLFGLLGAPAPLYLATTVPHVIPHRCPQTRHTRTLSGVTARGKWRQRRPNPFHYRPLRNTGVIITGVYMGENLSLVGLLLSINLYLYKN